MIEIWIQKSVLPHDLLTCYLIRAWPKLEAFDIPWWYGCSLFSFPWGHAKAARLQIGSVKIHITWWSTEEDCGKCIVIFRRCDAMKNVWNLLPLAAGLLGLHSAGKIITRVYTQRPRYIISDWMIESQWNTESQYSTSLLSGLEVSLVNQKNRRNEF